MKLLLLLLSTAAALPQQGGEPQQGKEEGGEDPGTIIRCMAENWAAGEARIQACRDCFTAVGDLATQAGLQAAKQCAAAHWPASVAGCQDEVSALSTSNLETTGQEVLECFDRVLGLKNNQRCLDGSQNSDMVEKLTDAAVCVIDSHKFAFSYYKNATMGNGNGKGKGKGKGKSKGRGKGDKAGKGMKGQVMRVMTAAHCDLAAEGDSQKSGQCSQCFKRAVMSMMRAKKGNKQAGMQKLVKKMTICSEKHLSPRYDQCTKIMKDGKKDGVEECYTRVLVKNLVSECSDDITAATAETLEEVVDCGKENVMEWMEDRFPKAARMAAKFFDDDEDEDDD